MLALAGDLQDLGLSMNGLSYRVSPELLEASRDEMLEAAMAKLKTLAGRTAASLDKTQHEFLQIDVNMGGGYHAPVMRAMAMESSSLPAKRAMRTSSLERQGSKLAKNST